MAIYCRVSTADKNQTVENQLRDLLAVAHEGDTALVNLSQRLKTLSSGLTPDRERQMIYGIVNTLCDSRGVRRVRLFIEGEQPDRLAGAVYLPGEFLRNPDIIGN